MLDTQEKVIITDLNGKHDVSMEVNFSSNPDSKDKVRIGIEGSQAVVAIKDLYDFVFLIADAIQQERLMPVKTTTVRKIIKRHIVEVTKDIKKGQKLNVRCETNVPVETIEGLAGMFEKQIKDKARTGIPLIRVPQK